MRYRLLDFLPLARRDVIDALTDAVILTDADGRVLDLNPAAHALRGAPLRPPRHEALTRILARRPPDPELESVERAIDEALESGASVTVPVRTTTGREPEISVGSVCDREGEPSARYAVVRDLIERRRFERLLRESQQRVGGGGLSPAALPSTGLRWYKGRSPRRSAMGYGGYTGLDVQLEEGLAIVTIDHPPLNLLDIPLMTDLERLSRELEGDDSLRAAVFRSANPDFFIAHADVTMIQLLPKQAPPKSTELSAFHRVMERFRTLPIATIGMVEGRARGGGSEFLLSLDMRFAALGRAWFAQPEVAVGIIPGGSGTQRLPRLMGRARSLEAVLGCDDFDAELAERYGWINRALPPEELEPFVMGLARRIASFPRETIGYAKASVDAAEGTTAEGLIEEAHLFNLSVASEPAQQRLKAFMAAGGQNPEAELEIRNLLLEISKKEG